MKQILFAISLLFTAFSIGQEIVDDLDSVARKLGTSNRFADSNYVKYYDGFGVHYYSSLHISSFFLKDHSNGNQANYNTPLSPAIGIGFNKYGFTVNLANDFGIIQQDKEKYGETSKLIFNSSVTYRRLAVSLYLNIFSGYYLGNSKEFEYYEDSINFPQRSDIRTYSFGFSNMHLLNGEKFSLNSSYKLTQKQLKSAGSIIIAESFDMFIATGESNFLPDSIRYLFSPYLSMDKSSQFMFGISAGYSYNFVFLKNFNFNLTALPSLNLTINKIDAIDPNLNTSGNISLLPDIALKSGLAYVNDKFYSGLNATFNNYWVNIGNDSSIKFNMLSFRFFAGYRIGSMKKKK